MVPAAQGVASSRRGAEVILVGRSEDDGTSARERALAVVVDMLEQGGEASVRIDDVRERSGVSIGAIYHHYGDRDGLIVAAQVRRFARYAEAETAALSDIVERAADLQHFRTAIRQLTWGTSSALRTAERWAQVAVVASTVGRDDLAAEVREIQTRLTDEFQAHVAQGQARGFFRADLDPRAIATFIEAYSLGRVLNDVDERPVSDEAWERVVGVVIDALLVDPTLRAAGRR